MTALDERAMRLARGLSLAETAALAVLLGARDPQRGLARLDPSCRGPLGVVIERIGDEVDFMRQATQARLGVANYAPVAPLHPEWLNRWRRREPALLAWLRGHRAQEPSGPWFRAWAASQVGVLDPRHVWEHQRGEVLELEQLALLPAEQLQRLVAHLGVLVVADALRPLPRRQLALVAARAEEPWREALLQGSAQGPPFGEGLHRVVRSRLVHLERHQLPFERQVLDLGLLTLALAALQRRQSLLVPLGYALPPELTELLAHHSQEAIGRERLRQLASSVTRPCLEAAQLIARAGHIAITLDKRSCIVAPEDAVSGAG